MELLRSNYSQKTIINKETETGESCCYLRLKGTWSLKVILEPEESYRSIWPIKLFYIHFYVFILLMYCQGQKSV